MLLTRRGPLSKYCEVKTLRNFVDSFSQHTAPRAAVLPAGDLHQWIMMTSCCVKSYFTYNTRIQHSQLSTAIIIIAQMFLIIKMSSEQISRLHLSVSTEQGAGCLLHVSTQHHHITTIKWFEQGICKRIITTVFNWASQYWILSVKVKMVKSFCMCQKKNLTLCIS